MKIKIWIIFSSITIIAFTGCIIHSNKKNKIVPKPPPFPSVTNSSKSNTRSVSVKVLSPSFTSTDFAITSIKTQQGNVILTWINGTPPFQVRSKSNILSSWEDFGPSTMLRTITNVAPYNFTKAFFKIKSISMSPPGSLNWVKQHTASLADGNGFATSVGLTKGNEIISAGSFFGTVDFGTGPISSGAIGNNDAFAVKYSSLGKAQWTKRIGGNSSDAANGLHIDSGENLFLTGGFSSIVDFGGIILTNISSGIDIFLAKYNTNNTLVWAKQFGGLSNDKGISVISKNGNLYLIATFSSSIIVFGDIVLTNTGGEEIAIVKLNSSGIVLWAKRYGGASIDRVTGITIDDSDNLWITGSFFGTSDLGSGPISSSPATQKAFLASYSGVDGSYRNGSLKTFGTSGNNSAGGVAIDPITKNIVIVGSCDGAVDFGGGLILNNGSTTGRGIFVASYTSNGLYNWAKIFGDGSSTTPTFGNGIAITSDGTIAITGQSDHALFTGTDFLIGGGYFIITLTRTGNYRWGRINSNGSSNGSGISINNTYVCACGAATGPVNFGPGLDGNNIIGTAPGGIQAAFTAQYLK